jgi:hypothetical protein
MEFSYDGHENDWGNLWFDWRNHIDMENHLQAWFLHIYLCFLQGFFIYVCTYVCIWVNYNDLTATSLESWLIRGIIPKWP